MKALNCCVAHLTCVDLRLTYIPAALYREKLINLSSLPAISKYQDYFQMKIVYNRDESESLFRDSVKRTCNTLDLTSFRRTSVFEEACGASYRTGRQTTRPMTSLHRLLSPAAGDQDLRLLYVKMLCMLLRTMRHAAII